MTDTNRIHPGRVVHVWDHYVITLRDDEAESHLSLYAVTYSPELGAGHVLVLRRPGQETLLLADDAGLGRGMPRRLRSLGSVGRGLPDDATPASFRRERIDGSRDFRWTARSAAMLVEAIWADTSDAAWVEGPAPAFWEREDIWAAFVSAERASISVDGRFLSGAPYTDEAWFPKIGRTLSSAHVALAEVRVTPRGD